MHGIMSGLESLLISTLEAIVLARSHSHFESFAHISFKRPQPERSRRGRRKGLPLLVRWLTLKRQYFQSFRLELKRCGVWI